MPLNHLNVSEASRCNITCACRRGSRAGWPSLGGIFWPCRYCLPGLPGLYRLTVRILQLVPHSASIDQKVWRGWDHLPTTFGAHPVVCYALFVLPPSPSQPASLPTHHHYQNTQIYRARFRGGLIWVVDVHPVPAPPIPSSHPCACSTRYPLSSTFSVPLPPLIGPEIT